MPKRNISDVLSDEELAKGGPSTTVRRLDRESQNSNATATQYFAYPNPSSSPKSIPFQQPSPLISFSYTPEHVLEFNNSALRYYRPPPPNAQLGYAYERWIRRPEERSRIDSLLSAVDRVTAPDDSTTQDRKMNLTDVGVVAWRGVITRILTAPYEDREGWNMNVMLVNGTLYLEEHRTESEIAEKNDLKPHHRKMMYYGYAFESYCTTDVPPSTSRAQQPAPLSPTHRDSPSWGGDVNTNVQWCSVVRTKLGDTKFIIGGEVDCVQDQYKETSTDTFVELKTSMIIRRAADEAKFEKKLLKFYFQSFLLGVPKIVVGFRTPSGELSTTQTLQTMQIPRMVRQKTASRGNDSNATWNPSLCLAWCYQFLRDLKQVIRESEIDPSEESEQPTLTPSAKVWRVTFVPREGARVTKLDRSAVEEVTNDEDRVGFLPRWYWDKISSVTMRAGQSHDVRIRSSAAAAQSVPSVAGGWQI